MTSRRIVRLGIVALTALTANIASAQPNTGRQPAPNNPFDVRAAADGRIVPAGGLIRIAAPAGIQGQPIMGELKVKVGDWVEAGELLAYLRDRPYLQAQLDAAEREKEVAAAAVTQAETGKARARAEIQAIISDLEGRALVAQANLDRYKATSTLALDAARREEAAAKSALEAAQQMQPVVRAVAAAGTAAAQVTLDAVPRTRDNERKIYTAQLEQAKAGQQRAELEIAAQIIQLQAQADLAAVRTKQAETAMLGDGAASPLQAETAAASNALKAQQQLLAAVEKQRDADIAAAHAQAASAQANAAVARVQLSFSELRAPSAARVLAIRARPGELIGPAGALEIGDTREIFVDALVYVDDIPDIRIGQKAMVVGVGLPLRGLPGNVAEISKLVSGNTLPSLDPTVFSDQTVVLVKVRLDEPGPAANLINGQVVVRFQP